MKRTMIATAIATAFTTLLLGGVAQASSHREAPLITKTPKVDGTDLYMFRSYETGRSGYVTFLANYGPFQDAFNGPNFNLMDEDATYYINIDNNGDAVADLKFQFRFGNFPRDIAIPVGGLQVAIPLSYAGSFDVSSDRTLNVLEGYAVLTSRGTAAPTYATNMQSGGRFFIKPFDNVGEKTIPEYAKYAERYIEFMSFPGCPTPARVFVSQRAEGFKIAVGEIFDLINLNPLGAPDAQPNDLRDKNVTSIALEVPISCLTNGSDPVIGAWTTATVPRGTTQMQVSRVGMPLVNEVIIGLKDKDKFNASSPSDDAQFATYVTNPTLPELIQSLYPSVTAPNLFPRTDLVAAFLTGVPGLNQPVTVKASEMLRLNTSIAPKTAINQENLGVLAGDTAGFPNGRRPGDDVVDIALRVAMGVLLPAADAPSGQLPFTDGATIHATDFRNTFPYLNTPYPGTKD